VHEAMKRKRKAAGTSSTSRNTSEATPGPQDQPHLSQCEESGTCRERVKGEERKMKDQDMEGVMTPNPGPCPRVENHISDHVTPAWHSGDIPEASTCPPGLPVNGALDQESRGPQQRRTEDASSTVQGLIMELSNINRLIMSTYRELRQKRVRHVPGRGSGKERRRREM
ncbi:break repair meiotic recombinase recruitment factor 1-like, partial [Dendropsophus ebraccatus]|uniref:break repair meiotic recombinase recruitment factor 1-like n=1 Tax=Dendropsophus ebraccatus TaxID=150705 RepID=UPI0038322EC9